MGFQPGVNDTGPNYSWIGGSKQETGDEHPFLHSLSLSRSLSTYLSISRAGFDQDIEGDHSLYPENCHGERSSTSLYSSNRPII